MGTNTPNTMKYTEQQAYQLQIDANGLSIFKEDVLKYNARRENLLVGEDLLQARIDPSPNQTTEGLFQTSGSRIIFIENGGNTKIIRFINNKPTSCNWNWKE